MAGAPTLLRDALDQSHTGDIWLFRGRDFGDKFVRAATNAPVNHVGMAVAIDDLPPLMWHAEYGRASVNVWTGERQRGVSLHKLEDAVRHWNDRYHQQPYLRQFQGDVTRAMEDELLKTVAHYNGRRVPGAWRMGRQWAKGRIRRTTDLETISCSELVALTYQAMGLLPGKRPANWYDPGRFWSGDRLRLQNGASLGPEIMIEVEAATT